MRVNYEWRKVEGISIGVLEWGDSFILAEDIEQEEPTVFILIEPDYGLDSDDEYEYAVDVENGEIYHFKSDTKVIEVRSEISVKKPWYHAAFIENYEGGRPNRKFRTSNVRKTICFLELKWYN